jgi:hypothetical protein
MEYNTYTKAITPGEYAHGATALPHPPSPPTGVPVGTILAYVGSLSPVMDD